jgi:hypothetical protein
MILYYKEGSIPQELPKRLTLPDGSTRTDPNDFTEEMISLAGWSVVPEKPECNFATHKIIWSLSDNNWIVEELIDTELKTIKENYLATIHQEVDSLLVNAYTLLVKNLKLQINNEPTIDSIEDLEAYIDALKNIESTYNGIEVVWPQYVNPNNDFTG